MSGVFIDALTVNCLLNLYPLISFKNNTALKSKNIIYFFSVVFIKLLGIVWLRKTWLVFQCRLCVAFFIIFKALEKYFRIFFGWQKWKLFLNFWSVRWLVRNKVHEHQNNHLKLVSNCKCAYTCAMAILYLMST